MKKILHYPLPISISEMNKLASKVVNKYHLSAKELFLVPSSTDFIIEYNPYSNEAKKHVLEVIASHEKLLPRSYLAIDFAIPRISLRKVGMALSSLHKHKVINCSKQKTNNVLIWTIYGINSTENWNIS